jgi:catechol 2,3-dioxygenase-like lactoylglutathione lyase family enzyme
MLTEDTLKTGKLGVQRNWTLSDAVANSPKKTVSKLPLASFNHIAREVLSIEKSKFFYVEILGFSIIPRPPFDSEGYWLYGYGLSLHLVETTVPEERKRVKIGRIQHFSSSLPRVDHIAFITSDISFVKKVLDDACVFYKEDCPKDTGIRQIFLFDPDGNVIEISNCSPEVGETRCMLKRSESIDHGETEEFFASEDVHDSLNMKSDWMKDSCDETERTTTDGNYYPVCLTTQPIELELTISFHFTGSCHPSDASSYGSDDGNTSDENTGCDRL